MKLVPERITDEYLQELIYQCADYIDAKEERVGIAPHELGCILLELQDWRERGILNIDDIKIVIEDENTEEPEEHQTAERSRIDKTLS